MNFKQIIQDYFTFSRNERKGITVLLVVIFLLAVANKVIFYFETPAKIDVGLLDSASNEMNLFNDSANSLAGGIPMPENETVRSAPSKSRSELFPFDPNTSSDKDFIRLGLTAKQIQTIRNYQSKGGDFSSKSDFLKIYGISDLQKKALYDYITIEKEKIIKHKKNTEISKIQIEINAADSIDLMELPGIGDKLSKRIVKYRDLLGGFHELSQLKEVYGFSEQAIQQIDGWVRVDPARIRKIDLNFADWAELAKHPYIQKNLARQIIKFRTKYGSIHQPSVLRDSMILNMDEYVRLKPYL